VERFSFVWQKESDDVEEESDADAIVKSDDVEEESGANVIIMIPPKNREVLHALDTIRRQLLFEGADINTFFRLEKEMQESMQQNIKQKTLAHYFM